MKKLFLLFCFSSFYLAYTQTSDSLSTIENKSDFKPLLDRLLNDDKMLNIMFDGRVDYLSDFNSNETIENGFKGHTLRLFFTGEVYKGVRYGARLKLNKKEVPSRDNYGSSVDRGFIEIDAGKDLTFRLGKQGLNYGTFEYDYSGADLYLISMCNNDLPSAANGLNIQYRIDKQKLNLQIINAPDPQFASEKYKNKALGGLIFWDGRLFDDLIKTKWGYAIMQHDGSKYYNWITLGMQLNLPNFITELDWFTGNRDVNYGNIVNNPTLGEKYVKDHSVSLNFRYNFGKFLADVKGTWSQREDKDDLGSYNTVGAQAALEYYPFTNERIKNVRFHLAYVYQRTNYHGVYKTLDHLNEHQIMAGMRWYLKIK